MNFFMWRRVEVRVHGNGESETEDGNFARTNNDENGNQAKYSKDFFLGYPEQFLCLALPTWLFW